MECIKKNAFVIIAALLLVHGVLSFLVAAQESAIFDEKAHIPAAYSYVRYGDMRLNPEHPPLIKDLSGLPLLFLDITFPLSSSEWQSGINEQWTIGDLFINCARPEHLCNDADAILFWSRAPIVIISLILGGVIFFWTRELGGTLAGLFATMLYAFDPNIIAHNHYVTTDIGSAAFIFFVFYGFVRFLKNPSPKNILLSGVLLGLAQLTKFSAVLLFPVFGLFVILYALTKKQLLTDSRTTLSFLTMSLLQYSGKFLGSILICFILIWIVYFFNTFNMPGEKLVALADHFLGQKNLFAQFAHSFVVTTSGSSFLKPFSEYFLGVFMVFARVASGNTHYFLGAVSDVSSPWYFPVVFTLKETLPFLFLLLLTTFFAFFRGVSALRRSWSKNIFSFATQIFHEHIALALSLFFIIFYGYISITGNLTIGFRHLFPILPFLYMLMAIALFHLFKRVTTLFPQTSVFSFLLGITTFCIVSIGILAYPHYLSYFNIAAGGHLQGYRFVTDSNYDWGQDLKNLGAFVKQHNRCKNGSFTIQETRFCDTTKNLPPIDIIRTDYFGGARPEYYLGDTYVSWWDKREPEAGWYAISSFFYQESLYKKRPAHERNYEWLKNIEPVTRAGDSIFIYYIPETKW
ncbi:MAG: glycosyltransferase family 39 protein [Candidatus Moranbacteria bacterium]|nr:glycosyltransferase family 39 protein [Candidatus Moranbacteria bacterium]